MLVDVEIIKVSVENQAVFMDDVTVTDQFDKDHKDSK